MFIVAQLPLADIRPLVSGGKGRLTAPDWTSDNLDAGFVRGFGKVSPRNTSGLRLAGESSFADTNNAVRFVERIELWQEDWKLPLKVRPWFRRMYFDGQLAGRFEFGFLIPEDYEHIVLEQYGGSPIDPSLLAQRVISANIQVNSVDGSKQVVRFADCAQALGHAYIAATTETEALHQFPASETFGAEVLIGKPMLHLRISAGRPIKKSRDRRVLNSPDEPEFFITSARGLDIRSNVIVQASKHAAMDESPDERLRRVLFAHLNALLFAHSHFVRAGPVLVAADSRAVLKEAVTRMLERFERLQNVGRGHVDMEFSAGMKLFAKAYAGRVEALVAKLEKLSEQWNAPSALERFSEYIKGVHDLIITTAVEAAVKSILKGG